MPSAPAAASAAARRLSPFEWACLGVVALAFLVRVPMILTPQVIWDSAWYLMLARSFAETGTFWIPWSHPDAPAYNGYWPPLFPVFLAPLVALLGPSYHTLVTGAALATALMTATVFATTRDLFGRTRAFAAAALVAANPAYVLTDSSGMSESLLTTMVVLTVWAFLKSLDRPAWLPVAAVFALLAYLGKASLGLPFVAAGVLAVGAFRVRMRGWQRTLRSPVDIGVAAAGLVAAAAFALTRTEKFGGIGLGFIEPLKIAILNPVWVPVFFFKLAFAAVFLAAVTMPASLRVREAWRARRGEREGALWLATLIPLALGAVFTTSFYLTEERNLVDFDNIRYLTPSIVPFLWLVLPRYDLEGGLLPAGLKDRRLHRRHTLAFGAAAGAFALLLLLNPMNAVHTLTRLKVFLGLSLLPLGLAAMVLTTHYAASARQTREGVETRLVPADPSTGTGTKMLALTAVALALAWFVSAWYAYVAIGLAIASTSMSPRARVVAIALFLLCATAPTTRSVFPAEDAAAELAAWVPPGTKVGVTEPAVYFAAVRPPGVQLVLLQGPVPDDVDALVLQHWEGRAEVENFTQVAYWDYDVRPFPTVAAELAIERALTDASPMLPELRAYTLFVRTSKLDNATAST